MLKYSKNINIFISLWTINDPYGGYLTKKIIFRFVLINTYLKYLNWYLSILKFTWFVVKFTGFVVKMKDLLYFAGFVVKMQDLLFI